MTEMNSKEVICPECTTQFRAIPVDVQIELKEAYEKIERLVAQLTDYVSNAAAANQLRDACHDAAFKAGWWHVPIASHYHQRVKVDVRKYPSHILMWWVGSKLALIHSELSEALEGLRKDKMDDHLPHLKSFAVEMGDAIIRAMDLCGGMGIDIGQVITEKLAYNATRADHKMENRDSVGGKAF